MEYIKQIWTGDRGLARCFWLNYICFNIFAMVVLFMARGMYIMNVIMMKNPEFNGFLIKLTSIYALIAYVILASIVAVAYHFVSVVGVFRATLKYQGLKVWKVLGFVAMLPMAILWLIDFALMFGIWILLYLYMSGALVPFGLQQNKVSNLLYNFWYNINIASIARQISEARNQIELCLLVWL